MPNAFLNDSVDATLASLYSCISLGQALYTAAVFRELQDQL